MFLYKYQFGFRKGYSTEQAILEITDNLKLATDKGQMTCVLIPASRIQNHNKRFVSNLNYFRPRVSTNLGKTSFKFSAPKIWETVPPGLKCLPYHKFKKEWKSCLLTNQIWPCLYVLSLILFEILFLSLLLPIISIWRCPTRKLLLLWTPYTNELNIF